MRSLFLALGCLGAAALQAPAPAASPDAATLAKMSARFAPVDITVDLSALPANERDALRHLVRAAELTDVLFLRQSWAGNEAVLLGLLRDGSALGAARLDYFLLNKGPWSRLDDNLPFVSDLGARPPQANFYPADATRDEIEAWLATLPQSQRAAASGFFTAIRRHADGRLFAVPYSVEYQGELSEMARHLRAAAATTSQPTLKTYLEKRAAAFLSNDYYESDVAWMQLDASIEPTIGPYEVYEDGWFNFKAAFEAFVALRDEAHTAKLARLAGELQWLENRLPIDPKYRRAQLGALAPLRVVDVLFAAGDGNRAVQTAAFNLPNDDRIVNTMGSKRVMLKNYQQAKFERALLPISKVALASSEQPFVNFDAFFTHILMHELMHGLGPKTVGVGPDGPGVRQQLKELYSTIEEAKADIAGLWALQQLMDRGVIDRRQERAFYTTFLASAFRTLRFGMTDAHAKGMAIQVNYLLDQGGFRVRPDGTFSVDLRRTKRGAVQLTRELMTLESTGDYAAAKALVARLANVRPEVQAVIARLTGVPVDIRPRFVTAEELMQRGAGERPS
jgi:hypothetical protein